MKFNNTAPDTDPFAPLPAGDYDFRIKAATETVSRTGGNPMFKLVLVVFPKDGDPKTVFHNIVFTESQGYRNKQAFEAIDLLQYWERGEMEASFFVGRYGQCRIGLKMFRGREENEVAHFYPYDPANPIPPALPAPEPARSQPQPPPAQQLHPDDNGFPPDPNFQQG